MTTRTQSEAETVGLSEAQLRELLRFMLLTREVDQRIRTLYLQGKVSGGVYSGFGHEAIAVGTAYALRPDDLLAPMHRDLGAHLVRGMDVGRILAQVMARETGYTRGRDNALHIGDHEHRIFPQISMLGTSIPLAAGAALTFVQRGEDSVSLTYVGDGAVNTGDFHEGLNFAAALRLPMILIVENNQYAYSTPLDRQLAIDTIAQRAVAYGIPGVRIDGNDLLGVLRTTREAVERARRGEGPTLIECLTMRVRGHSENDDARYVPPELLEEWAAKDPVERFERWIVEGGIIGRGELEQLRTKISNEVASAAAWADEQPFPDASTVLEAVYSDPPA